MISTQRALRIALAALGDCTRAAQAQNAFSAEEVIEARAASDELNRMLDASKTRDSISVIHGCTEVLEARP
jgi:hypothetical protein